MEATTGSGKGDLPREGQYSKESQVSYGEEYERIFGKDCGVCHGKGYLWDNCTLTKKMVKTTCLICKGTGKEKKVVKYTEEQRKALREAR